MSEHDDPHHPRTGFRGPRCWALSTVVGIALGILWAIVMPPSAPSAGHADNDHAAPRVKEISPDGSTWERLPSTEVVPWSDQQVPSKPRDEGVHSDAHQINVPLALCLPFGALLATIALMPFISAKFWHDHYPDVAFFFGAVVAAYYLTAFGADGQHAVLHSLLEYYSFIALVGGLFVVSGGILVRVQTRATPTANTALLATGAILANLVGTTGASMLLIRPFMRMNHGRLAPVHIVMFILVVSNCGGCLTPIGDPPLYLGYLKGVPFGWTITNMWPMWLVCIGSLLTIFFVVDARIGPRKMEHAHEAGAQGPHPIISIQGAPAIICLVLLVAGVFIDPVLKKTAGISGIPVGATFQLIISVIAYKLADRNIHVHNAFNFHPVKEVGMLFAGIFLTMIPALGYLAANASKLGLESPTQYYGFTGSLSAVLDNAPTYLNFLQSAMGVLHLPLDPSGVSRFIANDFEVIHHDGSTVRFSGQVLLEAISLGAVFFGAMTYIGNGPNFMVKSIAESSGVKMPSFFAYLGYALLILLPVLALVWAIFIR